MNATNHLGKSRFLRYVLFLLLFLPISLLGQVSKPIVFYYANGLQETSEGAKLSLTAIGHKLQQYWTEEELGKIFFLLSANYHDDSFNSILVEQLITRNQLLDESEKYNLIDYENNSPYTLESIIELIGNPLEQYYFVIEDIFIALLGSYIEENIGDLAISLSSVREDIEDDKCVIMLAHGEGIHRANIIHDRLSSTLKDPNQLQIIGAGIPAYRVAGDGPYVTLEEDEFIKKLGEFSLLDDSFFQGLLPANESNNPRYEDITGHQFLTYLYGAMSGPVLINYINQAIEVAIATCIEAPLPDPPSDSPKDFKITKIEHVPSLTFTNGFVASELKIYWESSPDFFNKPFLKRVTILGCPVTCNEIECKVPPVSVCGLITENSPNPYIHRTGVSCGKFRLNGSGTSRYTGELIATDSDSDNLEHDRIDINFTCHVGGG